MSKEEIIDLLKTYKEKEARKSLRIQDKQSLQRRRAKIEVDYETNMTSIYQEGGKGNQTTSKVENKILMKKEKIEEITKQIKEINEEIVELDYELAQVNIRLGSLNELENKIITAYYIDNQDYNYIGNVIYYEVKHQTRSEETIKRMVAQILNKLTKL